MRAARRPEMWRKSHAVFANTLALATADNEGIFHFLLLCRVALGARRTRRSCLAGGWRNFFRLMKRLCAASIWKLGKEERRGCLPADRDGGKYNIDLLHSEKEARAKSMHDLSLSFSLSLALRKWPASAARCISVVQLPCLYHRHFATFAPSRPSQKWRMSNMRIKLTWATFCWSKYCAT